MIVHCQRFNASYEVKLLNQFRSIGDFATKLEDMPTYEYMCHKCGQHFDVEQRMVDDPLTTHDECGGQVVRVFSSAGIVLKGSGFYKTDARSGSASKKSSKKTEQGSETTKKDSTDSGSTSTGQKSSSETKKSDSKPSTSN